MELKQIFAILSSAILIFGSIPYLKDIIQHKVHAHILSWIGWSFITALGAFAMLAGGSDWIVAMLFANTITCLLIATLSIVTKTGVWSVSKTDYIMFGLGIVGIILWQTLELPVLALICAIAADMFFGIPTLIKTYLDPSSETPTAWAVSVVAEILALLAATQLSFNELAYPIYLFLYDLTMLLLVLSIIKRKIKTSN